MSVVYLGIGSNIGDKEYNCEQAVRGLNGTGGIKVEMRSAFYRTKPVGGPPQEDYINGVVGIKTGFSPQECLRACERIEKDLKREKSAKDHPRIIDIDILLYDDVILRTDDLTIPHPRMHERYFVLRGLAEVAPDVRHPVFKETIRELYEAVRER